MIKLCVVGKDVSKSLSPDMHGFIIRRFGENFTYDNLSVSEENFNSAIEDILSSYDGVNVTIPYKLSVMSHLKEIDEEAKLYGAVNTVSALTRKGYNTDGVGFMLMLSDVGIELQNKKILVLGAGGVGRTVIKKLSMSGAEVFAYEKDAERLKELHSEFGAFTPLYSLENAPYDVIINCTGVGMHESEGISPVGEELLKLSSTAIDLIYAPPESEFLRLAKSLGKRILNGEAMLFYQAYYGDCIFLSKKPYAAEAEKMFEEYKKERNI